MKALLTLATLFIFNFISSQAIAHVLPWQGVWVGAGTLKHSTGLVENCQLRLVIERNDSTFLVKQSLFDCESMRIKNKNQTPLEIKNNSLWYGQFELGSFSNTEIHTQTINHYHLINKYDMTLETITLMRYQDQIEWVKGYTTEIFGYLEFQQEDTLNAEINSDLIKNELIIY